jgi:hypothetical protein
MGEMIQIALVKGLPKAPSNPDDHDEIGKDDAENDERFQDHNGVRFRFRIEMREDGKDREKISDQMAPGIAQKNGGTREIEWQKTQQRSASQERNGSDEVLALIGGGPGEGPCGDETQAGTKSIHVIHEIGGVGDGQDPEDRDGVAEDGMLDEQCDSTPAAATKVAMASCPMNLGNGASSCLSSSQPSTSMPMAPIRMAAN